MNRINDEMMEKEAVVASNNTLLSARRETVEQQ